MNIHNHSTPSTASSSKPASILVIDPKHELRGHVAAELAKTADSSRLIVIDRGVRLDFFEGNRSLPITAKLAKLDAVAPLAWYRPEGSSANWIELSKSFIRKMVQYDGWGREQHRDESALLKVWRMLLRHEDTASPASYFAMVEEILGFARSGTDNLKEASRVVCQIAGELGIPRSKAAFLKDFCGTSELIEQFNYICMEADNFLGTVGNPDVTEIVDFSPFSQESCDVLQIFPLVETGKVILFSPDAMADETINIIGKCLKTKFFQAVFSREDKKRPMAYVCDEFQRFITADEDSGEQSFLDRCRAYRTSCVLATQSVAALRYVLRECKGAEASIDIVLNNTANKILMRNTDEHTLNKLRSLIPSSPHGGRHIAEVRPLTTLACGEAYYLLANGKWGRSKINLPTTQNF